MFLHFEILSAFRLTKQRHLLAQMGQIAGSPTSRLGTISPLTVARIDSPAASPAECLRLSVSGELLVNARFLVWCGALSARRLSKNRKRERVRHVARL